MSRIRDFFVKLFYGRYGVDKLYYFLAISYLVISAINVFLNSVILLILSSLLLVFMIYRIMSKNFTARQHENQIYLRALNSVKCFVKLNFNRIRYAFKYRFRKCPNCKCILKLPVGHGKKRAVCPKCNNHFDVHLL